MIYAIRCVGGPVKFGHSNNPWDRLADLQVSHYEKLYLLAFATTCGKAREIEKLIHKHCQHDRIRGEWFEVTPTTKKIIRHISRNSIDRYLLGRLRPASVKEFSYQRVDPKEMTGIRRRCKRHAWDSEPVKYG